MNTILLLSASNVFMTFAWYGTSSRPRPVQLKIIQEVITLFVFVGFALAFLKEKLACNHIVAFAFLGLAAVFAFAFKASRPA